MSYGNRSLTASAAKKYAAAENFLGFDGHPTWFEVDQITFLLWEGHHMPPVPQFVFQNVAKKMFHKLMTYNILASGPSLQAQ